jgi:DHA1 family multidrug resistance protein-like MFS transporter
MKKVFAPLAFAMFTSNLGMGIVAPLLSVYARDMGASGVWIGLIMASYAIANIISTPLFGRLSDRRGRKVFLCVGLLAYSIISLGYIIATNLPLLSVVRLLQGTAGGMVMPIATAYIGDISPRGEEGKWMGYAGAAFFIGFGIGPLLGGVLSQFIGMTFTFIFMSALNFLAFWIVLIFLPEAKARRVDTTQKRASFKEILNSRVIKGLFAFQIAAAMGQGSFTTFLPIIATARGFSLTVVGIILSCTICFNSVLGALFGRFADKLNKRWLIVGGSCIILLSLSAIPQAGIFWILLPLCLAMATGSGLASPSVSALAVAEGRKFGMGSTMGIVNMGMSIGFALGPIIAGKVSDLGQTSYAFYFGSAMLVCGIIVFLFFTRPTASTPSQF